jgi:hypothetical protein
MNNDLMNPWDSVSATLSKRELFASMAMMGLVTKHASNYGDHDVIQTDEALVDKAVELADMLLTALKPIETKEDVGFSL